MYRKSVWWSADKNYAVIKKYHAAHCEPSAEKNKKRRARKESMSWKQEEINQLQRQEKLERLLLDNFRPGDWYITLTYGTGKLPQTEEQARDDFKKFIRSVRGLYKKENLACQWIGIIEHLRGGGRTHIHFMLPALAPEKLVQLKKLWPGGNLDIRFFGGTAFDAHKIGGYFAKEERALSSVLRTSRNLLRTEPRKKTELADTWKDNYQPPEGYEVVELLSFKKTRSEKGYAMQKIVLQRINPLYSPRSPLPPPKKEKKKKGEKHGTIKKAKTRTGEKQAPAQNRKSRRPCARIFT